MPRQYTQFPIKEYDDNGNKTYVESSNGTWVERKYDEFNNVIHVYDSSGIWWKKKYDMYTLKEYEDSDGNYWNINMNIELPYTEKNISKGI